MCRLCVDNLYIIYHGNLNIEFVTTNYSFNKAPGYCLVMQAVDRQTDIDEEDFWWIPKRLPLERSVTIETTLEVIA